MKVTASGRALIEQREGRRLSAYRDSRGIWTIGVGHAATGLPPKPFAGMRISEAECDAMLASDLAPVEAVITKRLAVPISAGEGDAMASLGFNIGSGGLAKSTVIKRLNLGDIAGAADAFLMWSKPAELIGRRRAERAQFLQPDSATMLARAGALQHAASIAKAGARTARRRAATVATTGGSAALTTAAAHHGTAGLVTGIVVLVAAAFDGWLARSRSARATTLAANAGAHIDAIPHPAAA